MRADHDWELLDITDEVEQVHARSDGPPWRDHRTTTYRRARVSITGREGRYLDRDAALTPADALMYAAELASTGPASPPLPYGAHYPDRLSPIRPETPQDLGRLLHFPGVLQVLHRIRTARFRTACGHTLHWQHPQTRIVTGIWAAGRPVPLACTDHPEVPPPLPAIEACPYERSAAWLCSPLALAGLLIPHLPPPGPECSDLGIVDRGHGPPTDHDGAARQAAPGAWPAHTGLTGAPEHFDAYLPPAQPRRSPADDAVCVIASARWMPAGPNTAILTIAPSMRSDTRPVQSLLAQIHRPREMLAAGQWVNPVQRGEGPWSSAWLELPDPASALTIIHCVRDEAQEGTRR